MATKNKRSFHNGTRYTVSVGWADGEISAKEVAAGEEVAKLGRLLVPKRFQLSIIEPSPAGDGTVSLVIELRYVVDDEGDIRLAQISSDPLEVQDALTLLRKDSSLDDCKRVALMMLAADEAERTVATTEASTGREIPVDVRTDLVSTAIRTAHGIPLARRRNRITDQHLLDVANVYREAWKAGQPPTKAVQDKFHTTHSTAARWVGQARKAGHLGETAGARGGEIPQFRGRPESPDESTI